MKLPYREAPAWLSRLDGMAGELHIMNNVVALAAGSLAVLLSHEDGE